MDDPNLDVNHAECAVICENADSIRDHGANPPHRQEETLWEASRPA